jgi:single-stranded DNA-binding protein
MTHAITTLLGRAGRDAEVRMTPTGKQIVTCSVATGSGDKTTWFLLQAWEKTGEYLKDVKKGDLVYASGSLTAREYEGKMGKRTSLELNATVIRTTGTGKKENDVPDFTQPGQRGQQADVDLDIPF